MTAGQGELMRAIWSFWEGLGAKASVCHNVRVIHMSTTNHFPLLVERNERMTQDLERVTMGRDLKRVEGLFLGLLLGSHMNRVLLSETTFTLYIELS